MIGLYPQAAVEAEVLDLDRTGPRVVAIGGGHGLAAALEAIQSYASQITAIVSVADNGGSSGRLTTGLGIPPPGDVRRCLLALTPEPSVWSELFSYRFQPGTGDGEGGVGGHSLGNLILAALTDLTGDFADAVRRAGELLGAVGLVVPAATAPVRLTARVGGAEVSGQVAISRSRGGIERLDLGPDGITATPAAVAAIGAADQIVLGPGSLFTSVVAALRVPGIVEAVNRSPGRVVAVLNLVTQDGETLGLGGIDHIAALQTHGGLERPGVVVAHRGALAVPAGLEAVRADGISGWEVVEAALAAKGPAPAHDTIRLGAVLRGLVP